MLQEVLGFLLGKAHGKDQGQDFLAGRVLLPGQNIIAGGSGKACGVEDFSGLQAFFFHQFLQLLAQRGMDHRGLDLRQVVLDTSGTVEDGEQVPGLYVLFSCAVCFHEFVV